MGKPQMVDLHGISRATFDDVRDYDHPFHDRDVLVTACTRLCLHRKRINISTVVAGQKLGIREVDEGKFGSSALCIMIWDTSTWSRKPCNPSTTRSARGCHPCLGTSGYVCVRAG